MMYFKKILAVIFFIAGVCALLVVIYVLGLSTSDWYTAPLHGEDIAWLIGFSVAAVLAFWLGKKLWK